MDDSNFGIRNNHSSVWSRTIFCWRFVRRPSWYHSTGGFLLAYGGKVTILERNFICSDHFDRIAGISWQWLRRNQKYHKCRF